MVEQETISILGTGDFGRALAKALLDGGYRVCVGSRHPERRDLAACNVTLSSVHVTTLEDAILQSDVIFLAMHSEAQQQLGELEEQLSGKILVDVSNVTKRDQHSNAEKLQTLLPKSSVVKAFNTLSAYTIMTGHSAGSQDVHVAADDAGARTRIMDLARGMGFNAHSAGGLQASRGLEASTTTLFRGWGAPLIVSLLVFAFWFTYGTIRYHYIKDHEWSRVPMNTMNKATGCASITLLALCYLPGSFAAFAQLFYGTKHRRFAAWLDRWLRMRKELGLMSLYFAILHCVLSVSHITPGYFSKWFKEEHEIYIPSGHPEDVIFKVSPRMTLIGELVVLTGALSLSFMALLGITSLPSVGARLNWRQWTFVQSYVGHACLVVAAVHVSLNACPSWGTTPILQTAQKLSFLSLLLPYLTLFLRLLLVLPCFSIVLYKIRRGWERGQNNDISATGSNRRGTVYSPPTTRKSAVYDNSVYVVNDNAV